MAEWDAITVFQNLGTVEHGYPVYIFYAGDDNLRTLITKGLLIPYGVRERYSGLTAEPEPDLKLDYETKPKLYRVLQTAARPKLFNAGTQTEKAPRARKVIYTGKTVLNNGMFMTRDKIPFISYVKKLDGIALPSAKVIIEGTNNKVVLSTDLRGIVAEYVAADTYTKALVISRNNIVYELTDMQNIDGNEYMFSMKVKRLTKANVPYRQIHRNFQ